MRSHITAAMAVILMTALSTGPGAATDSAPHVRSGYAPVNGLKMYYEIHGTVKGNDPPLVLLHGGGSTIDTSFGKVLRSFAETRQVIAFEQQGHGHTADIGRPFSFEQSADGDIVRPEHAVEMFRLLPHAQLAVLPGTDHMTVVNRAEWLVSMIEAFLDAPIPKQR